MLLCNKLKAISSHNELSKLVNKVHVSIDWWGRRVVRVDGYEGTVQINDIATKFLSSTLFLQSCYLWPKIRQLYIRSNRQLRTMSVFRYVVGLKEVLTFFDRSMATIMAGSESAVYKSIKAWNKSTIPKIRLAEKYTPPRRKITH